MLTRRRETNNEGSRSRSFTDEQIDAGSPIYAKSGGVYASMTLLDG